jgi:hypothetical protein
MASDHTARGGGGGASGLAGWQANKKMDAQRKARGDFMMSMS